MQWVKLNWRCVLVTTMTMLSSEFSPGHAAVRSLTFASGVWLAFSVIWLNARPCHGAIITCFCNADGPAEAGGIACSRNNTCQIDTSAFGRNELCRASFAADRDVYDCASFPGLTGVIQCNARTSQFCCAEPMCNNVPRPTSKYSRCSTL